MFRGSSGATAGRTHISGWLRIGPRILTWKTQEKDCGWIHRICDESFRPGRVLVVQQSSLCRQPPLPKSQFELCQECALDFSWLGMPNVTRLVSADKVNELITRIRRIEQDVGCRTLDGGFHNPLAHWHNPHALLQPIFLRGLSVKRPEVRFAFSISLTLIGPHNCKDRTKVRSNTRDR